MIAGFTEIDKPLVRNRDGLLSEGGPLAAFADARVRHIVRATRTYGMFLQESFHPDLLRGALDRDRFFDNLWTGGEADAELAKLHPHEMRDLHAEDVPLFSQRPGSRHPWCTSNQLINDYFSSSALSLVSDKVRGLDDEDMTRQIWLIRASFTAAALGEKPARWPRFGFDPPEQGARREELREAARRVGDRLGSLSLGIGQGVSWLTLELVNEKTWSLVPMRESLYDGLSGVALFLGYLGAITGERRYRALAESAVTTILGNWRLPELVERGPHLTVGAFGDLGGTIYALNHLGVLWNRPDLLDEAEGLVELLPPLVAEDRHYGLLNGAAGRIKVLSGLHLSRPSKRNLALARECGDRLVADGRPEGEGIAGLKRTPKNHWRGSRTGRRASRPRYSNWQT